MKKILIIILGAILLSLLIFKIINKNNIKKLDDMNIILIINNVELNIDLEKNETTLKMLEILKEKDIVIEAEDYNGFEKVGPINFNLPTHDQKINGTSGDILLYQGNKITILYDNNSWTYTKIGHIKNIDNNTLKELLGDKNITIKFKLKEG